MKRMLINATQEEELRMAMVDGQRLYDLNIELPSGERKKANIYKGQITRIEPSLEAAFVNYGADRHGFLPLKEISSEYFVKSPAAGSKPNIREVLQEGQDIVIQIDKEERGNKGAALTTYVSLAGRFIVLKPNKARSGGVSRRIVGEDRDLARTSLKEINVPDGMSVILRTAGIGRGSEEFSWDLENLLAVWETIKRVVVERPSPFLIYRESNAVVRALRDYMSNDIGEILIDDEATHKEALEFVEQVMPHNVRKLKFYSDPVPLFTRYQIESQIESAFAHSVTLPSGGSLVIDHTEALVSIDINSARATKGGDIEATALNTNLEAADEVARQLRLRDLGGLVVIDFIDMGPQRNQRDVENRLREAVRQDRARVQIGKISRFGLLEMSRQRLRPSLGESSYLVCPRCSGIGNIRSVESLALAILRIIGEEARKERTAKVIAQLPVEVATYLLNEKRDWVQNVESRNDTQVIMIANSALETPHYQVRRVRDDQVELPENAGISYTLADSEESPEIAQTMQEPKQIEVAAIATSMPRTPAPARKTPARASSSDSLWSRILAFFGASSSDKKPKKSAARKSARGRNDNRRRNDQRSPRRKNESGRSADKRGSQRSKSGQGKKPRKAAGKKAQGTPAIKRSDSNSQAKASDSDENQQNKTRKAGSKRRSRGGRRRQRSQDSGRAAETKASQDQPQDQNESPAAAKPAPANTDKQQAEAPAKKPTRPRNAQSKSRAEKDDRQSSVNEGADSSTTRAPKTASSRPEDAANESSESATTTNRDAAGSQAVSGKASPAESPQSASRPESKPGQDRKTAADKSKDAPTAPVEKSESAAVEKDNGSTKSSSSRTSVHDGEKGATKPEPQNKDNDKPQGRLLPWEPQTTSAEKGSDKEMSDR